MHSLNSTYVVIPAVVQDGIHSGSGTAGKVSFGPKSSGLKHAKLCNFVLSLQGTGMNVA